jgi:hypothetical protein
MPYLRQLVTGFPPGSSPGQVMWDFWWTKWHSSRFSRGLRFPLPILISPTAHNVSSGAGTIGQLVSDVQSGLSLNPPQETKKLTVQ